MRILKPRRGTRHGEREDLADALLPPRDGRLLHRPALRWGFLGGVVVLLLGSCSLFYFEFVKVKMLPFDNKSEFQVIVDMPNGTTLEETARVPRRAGRGDAGAARSGEPADLRRHGVALQLQRPGAALLPAARLECGRHPGEPAAQGRAQAAEPRDRQAGAAAAAAGGRSAYGARIKVAEVPPGPPVLQTLVAEVYGPAQERADRHRAADPRPVEADRRRGGRGLVCGRRPAEVPPAGGPGEGRAERHLRGRYCAHDAGGLGGLSRPDCCTSMRRRKTSRSRCGSTAPARSDLDADAEPEGRRARRAGWWR